jgi:O-methyltransferase involved in polyketide biosynthesis
MTEALIANVSDTARWVAVYRARETTRPDALFKDPFADRLAGERGLAIAAAAPRQTRNGWPWVVRTRLIDDLIQTSIKEGCALTRASPRHGPGTGFVRLPIRGYMSPTTSAP